MITPKYYSERFEDRSEARQVTDILVSIEDYQEFTMTIEFIDYGQEVEITHWEFPSNVEDTDFNRDCLMESLYQEFPQTKVIL